MPVARRPCRQKLWSCPNTTTTPRHTRRSAQKNNCAPAPRSQLAALGRPLGPKRCNATAGCARYCAAGAWRARRRPGESPRKGCRAGHSCSSRCTVAVQPAHGALHGGSGSAPSTTYPPGAAVGRARGGRPGRGGAGARVGESGKRGSEDGRGARSHVAQPEPPRQRTLRHG